MLSPLIAPLAAALILALAGGALALQRSRQRRLLGTVRLNSTAPTAAGEVPDILYFTGENCTVCRTHQEPALAKLGPVRVDKVDAIAERELADRFQVYTLPTTVVMSAEGRALHVNYGYAPAQKLDRQLAEARNGAMLERTATA